jgi:glycosyltransferase involved in cell wall biosynthesis
VRILQLSSAQTLGGGERHLTDLANALAARGHDIYAVLRPKSRLIGELSALAQNKIVTLPLRNALDAPSARALSQFVREHEIEIVHAHMARDYPLAAYATRRNPVTRLVITRHVLFPLSRLHAMTMSHLARLIAVSEAVANGLRAQGLVPPDRITVVPNGVNIQRFDAALAKFDRAAFCRQWQLPEECLLVGTVGEINALKGHEDLLHAAATIVRRFPNCEFLIAGVDTSTTGEHRAALVELIAKLGLASQVHLFGWLDDIASFYRALDVFVSASQTESFGLAIAEAMACGTVVVATATAGAKEIIVDEKLGLLVPVGGIEAMAAAVIGLLEDRDQRLQIGAQAYRAVRKRFSLERMVDATEKIYRESLAAK